MALSVEIIDFSVPTCNRKNLFVTNIPLIDECQLYETLYEEFSKFGLLHEIQVFPSKPPPGRKNSDQGFYAFVKFYSYRAATCARQNLHDKLTIADKQCKVSYAKRRKGDNQVTTLQLSKCYGLANYYLGFNGWCSKMLVMEQDKETEKEESTSDLMKIRFFCKVGLELKRHNLSCDGFGAWEETLPRNDTPSRGGVMAKVKKMAYKRAMEHAFSKLLIISLSNGKVSAEVNTTLPDQNLQENQLDEDQLLKVNELTEEPVEEEADFSDNMDDINMQILQELEDELG